MDEDIIETIKKQVSIFDLVLKEMGVTDGSSIPEDPSMLNSVLAIYAEVNRDLRGERMERARSKKPNLITEKQKKWITDITKKSDSYATTVINHLSMWGKTIDRLTSEEAEVLIKLMPKIGKNSFVTADKLK